MQNTLAHRPPAGLLRRLLAGLYDWLLIIALAMIASIPVVIVYGEPIPVGNPLYRFAFIGIATLFYVYFWSRNGQTPGMLAWRIRVTTADGHPPSIKLAGKRLLLACLSFAAAGIGFLLALTEKEKRTWHDLRSNTRVELLPKRRQK
jgi:uncharacterized RDD family membrane protein YckC